MFYLEDDGTSPVEEFLDNLDLKTRARFCWSMEQLRLRNVQVREPLVRHLGGDKHNEHAAKKDKE
ncbi:hypothetical protein HKBW3S43_01666 [Candidatus Hakubella thermalkaliphila]|uniref:Uncharacterized protein n=2 Tax=Candidatus Hakubella thermalkaliphila TaxID=2754717 RepID=A0A6V8PTG3_9ACTN|nr:hypothetical protein [Candidatus Hakubella thermalkaliphila]GFP35879.1 hypothetical protein HKBW3S43_01666 [Candidatus Hakubella thermalkaliphila]